MARKKKNAPAARNAGTPGSDYAQWLMLVPKDKRQAVAQFIRANPINDYDDMIRFNCEIMAALIEGRITPVVAVELRQWHELNFSVISAKNSLDGTPDNTFTDVITALVQVKRNTQQLRGDYFDAEELPTGATEERLEVQNG